MFHTPLLARASEKLQDGEEKTRGGPENPILFLRSFGMFWLKIMKEKDQTILQASCCTFLLLRFSCAAKICEFPNLVVSNLVVCKFHAETFFFVFFFFCVILRTCVCALLRSFACFCVPPCLEQPRFKGTAELGCTRRGLYSFTKACFCLPSAFLTVRS